MKNMIKERSSSVSNYSLDSLIEHNEAFKAQFKDNLLFKLIESGQISAENNREAFLNYMQVWANYFQKAMLLKTALCDDPSFSAIVKQHFEEEYGHDKLLADDRKKVFKNKDAILEAVCNWFPSKILSFNQYEQVVVMNLCLEGAANVFYKYAISLLDPAKQSKYFQAHHDVDEGHEKMGITLLEALSEKQYSRLFMVQEEAWAMINALLKRIGELSIQQSNNSL
jgi:hypothetical protein